MTKDLGKEKVKMRPQTAWLFDVDGVLSDPESDVMACFSSIPKSKELGVKL